MNALLALFLRSLRETVRLRTTYFARAGLVFFVLLELVIAHLSHGWAGAPGLSLFNAVIWTDLLFISFVGLSYFASAITEEKEEMTLGLLRMTDLNPLSILLGKSTSRLCGVLLLLAAQFPFTLLAVAFGGVKAGQILAAYTCLAAFIFFLANLALFFSVIARRSAGAAIYTGVTIFALLIAPGVIEWSVWVLGRLAVLASPKPGPRLTDFLAAWQLAWPFTRLEEISRTGFGGSPLCWQVASNFALGLVCFALAWAAFHRFADQPGESAPPRTMAAKKSSPFAFLGAGRPWRCALVWKDFYFIGGGKLIFALKVLASIGLAVLCFEPWRKVRPHWDIIGYEFTGWFGLLLALDLTFAASRIFRLERKAQTLSSLVALPMTVRRLAWQKVFAALFASLPFFVGFVFGLALAVPALVVEIERQLAAFNNSSTRSFFPSFVWIIVGYSAVLSAGVVLVMHLAAWLSLRLKWGAFPLAFAVWFVVMQLATALLMVFFQQAGLFILAGAELFVALILHAGIGRRIEELAAED